MHHDFLEQGNELSQLRVLLVACPCLNEDAAVFLQEEVLGDVVDNDGLLERTPNFGQILDNQRVGILL